jgi:hypothetical protein
VKSAPWAWASNGTPSARICNTASYSSFSFEASCLKKADFGRNNHKYEKPYLVTVQSFSHEFYESRQFPQYKIERLSADLGERCGSGSSKHLSAGHLSQSERDWAYAKRSLARGDAPREVIDAIAAFRSDKPHPRYYAELTVKKALQTLTHDANRESLAVDSQRAGACTNRYSAR